MAEAAGKGGSSGRRRGLALVLVGAVALAALVFALARREGAAPPLPRPVFTEAEVRAALDDLRERAATVSVTDDERVLITMFEELGRAEAAAPAGPEDAQQVEGMVKAVGEVARARAVRNLERYLRLGDLLAVEFDRALGEVRAEAQRSDLEAALRSEAGDRLQQLGGSFARRAAERGLIREDGTIDGPVLLPEVLFRVRWRALAGLDRREGLSPLEWRAHMDFVLSFSKPSSVEARLQAIDEIAALEPGFDTLIARTVVLHEAGKDGEALTLLNEAIAGGRTDEPITGFARLLNP